MANFKIAEAITGATEGGLANNPNDHGGFTYAGIAEAFWPGWIGWAIVKDTLAKCNNDFHLANKALKANVILQKYVSQFYEKNFWDINLLTLLNDQQLANNAYDCGVNSGTGIAATFLQEAYNFSYPAKPLNIDGDIGELTITAINNGDAGKIFNELNALRKQRYLNIIAKKPSQAQFKKSWLGRLLIYKKANV